MPISGKDVVKMLIKKGWIIKRVRGSHMILAKNGKRTVIPVHSNKPLGIGLIREIGRQTGEEIK